MLLGNNSIIFFFLFSWGRLRLLGEVKFRIKRGFIYPAVLEGSGRGNPRLYPCGCTRTFDHCIAKGAWISVRLALCGTGNCRACQEKQALEYLLYFLFVCFVFGFFLTVSAMILNFPILTSLWWCVQFWVYEKELYKQCCELGIPEFSLKGDQSFVYLSFQPVIWWAEGGGEYTLLYRKILRINACNVRLCN